MLICGENSIRAVMAFPKNNRGQELMTQSPAPADARQLRELRIVLDVSKSTVEKPITE
jgi:aspartyl-tRNA synthetase